jgi:hypothetical protein
MPNVYYSSGPGGPNRPPRWIGSVLYVDAATAELRRMYDRQDATPLPPAEPNAGPRRFSMSAFLRRIVGLSGATS